jgi:hypothetical protein
VVGLLCSLHNNGELGQLTEYSVWLQTGQSGIRFPAEAKDFSFSFCVQTSSEAHRAFYPLSTRGPFPRVNVQPGRDANHSSHLGQ